MLDRADLEFPAEIAHTAGFQLKHSERIGFVKKIVSLGIVERELFYGNVNSTCLLDHLARVANHGQGFQAQEIHLEEAQITDRSHCILRYDAAVLILLEREQIH